ncbi:MAG: cytochrome c class [Rhizobacter sp.]|nr:cytochrome c class [Rhizobacter sp.]
MRPSLRFVAALLGTAVLCAAASISVLEVQDRNRARDGAEKLTGGHVDAGKQAMRRYGCGACHQIRGIDGAAGKVGPSLNGMALRSEVAGLLDNRPDNLVRWIRHPQEVSPGNGMPDLSVTEQDARDMAAYLYTLQ